MKSTKKILKAVGLAVVMLIIMISITGCMSMVSALGKLMIKDYGVYNTSIPEDQSFDLIFSGVNIRSFDGNWVSWGEKANNMGRIKLPAGKHDIIFDYLEEDSGYTGLDYNVFTGTIILIYTITTRSLNNIKVPQIEYIPGHRYQLTGNWINNEVFLRLFDITNIRADIYGDTVVKAPKESKTPTKFEGVWKGNDNTTFKFAGNTWELTMPPRVLINYSDDQTQNKGTFEIVGDNLIMHLTHVNNGGNYFSVGGLKSSYIWKYMLDDDELQMEIEYLSPQVIYSK